MRNIKLTIEYDGGRYDGWQRLGKDSVVATVFADDNKKYLSTDYSVPQPAKEGYLTNDIQLMNVAAYR